VSNSVIDAIVSAAHQLGVDPVLAIADSYVESGWNPRAVGDGGTSFGLFQLHRGGELGSLTPEQAFDPLTNALRALSEFALVQKRSPGLDPGQLAAQSERPAHQDAYAARVDQVLAELRSGTLKLPDGSSVAGLSSGSAGSPPAQLLGFDWGKYIASGVLPPSLLPYFIAQQFAGHAGDPFAAIGGGIASLGQSIGGIPADIGHGLAGAFGAGLTDLKVFGERQLVALVVAAVVLYVLFAEK
jgi:hypothetical protein